MPIAGPTVGLESILVQPRSTLTSRLLWARYGPFVAKSSVARAGNELPSGPRVQEIVRIMAAGEWRAGASHLACAKEWGVSTDVVEKVAAVASKIVRHLANTDKDQVRTLLVCSLEDIRDKALGTGDWRAATGTISEQAKLLGLHAPTEQKVELTAPLPPWHDQTPDEQVRRIDDAIQKLSAMRMKLLPKCAVVSHNVEVAAPALPAANHEHSGTDSDT